MAPKTKRSRASSSSADLNVDQWLWNQEAKTRFEKMDRSNFFGGAFVKFEEFSAYRIQEITTTSGLYSLLNFHANHMKINHLMVKLFYANMGLDHHEPQNREDCIWTMVCGVKIFLPLSRLGEILQCSVVGTELDQIDVDLELNARDGVSHGFLNDDIPVLRSAHLRPQARILHRALIRSITPRTGSYEEVRKLNFQALYAIYSRTNVNWARLIMTEFMDVSRRRKYKTFHYGAYIMRILLAFNVPVPNSEFTTISELGPRTLGLMGLAKRPQSLAFISFATWQANQAQSLPQPGARQQREIQEEEGGESDDSGEIEVISPEASSRSALVTLSRNQSKLKAQLVKHERKTEKRFNSIRGFLNKIWERIGCSGASSSQAFDPAPFQWTSSSGNNGDGDAEDSGDESSSEI